MSYFRWFRDVNVLQICPYMHYTFKMWASRHAQCYIKDTRTGEIDLLVCSYTTREERAAIAEEPNDFPEEPDFPWAEDPRATVYDYNPYERADWYLGPLPSPTYGGAPASPVGKTECLADILRSSKDESSSDDEPLAIRKKIIKNEQKATRNMWRNKQAEDDLKENRRILKEIKRKEAEWQTKISQTRHTRRRLRKARKDSDTEAEDGGTILDSDSDGKPPSEDPFSDSETDGDC